MFSALMLLVISTPDAQATDCVTSGCPLTAELSASLDSTDGSLFGGYDRRARSLELALEALESALDHVLIFTEMRHLGTAEVLGEVVEGEAALIADTLELTGEDRAAWDALVTPLRDRDVLSDPARARDAVESLRLEASSRIGGAVGGEG